MNANNFIAGATGPRLRKRWIFWGAIFLWACVAVWNITRPMPPGTDVSTPPVAIDAADIRFLTDLTYSGPQGLVHEQQIFDEVFGMVERAETFIVADFFLFNELMGAADSPHRPLSRQLAERLIARKQAKSDLAVLLITDPINDIYGSSQSPLLAELRAAGIEVVVTDLQKLRDSNPAYSALWRMFGQWWGTGDGGATLPNPFDTEPAQISLRSWLSLLNFKANHRKLIVADRADGRLTVLVASANPHDASSAHSNVALLFTGDPAQRIVESELEIAAFSGWRGHILATSPQAQPPIQPAAQLSFVTERAILEHLLGAIGTTRNGDVIRIATFYLSHRQVIDALLQAADRGVAVRIILDPNRDAFGRQKDGVPNRPVANELVTQSVQRIEVRWYRTHGEQFHTKLALITRGDRLIASLGSANLTRRNLDNYNLEANVALDTVLDSALASQMIGYFERLWNNEGAPGTEYTAPFGAYRDTDRGRYWRYRLMEATGLSTF